MAYASRPRGKCHPRADDGGRPDSYLPSVEHALDVAGLPRARADEVLAQIGLDQAADRRVGGFSLGMRQRLALAAGLCGLVGVLVWVLVVEGLLLSLLNVPSLGKWLPSAAAAALTNPSEGHLSSWAGGLLFAAYGLAFSVVGTRFVIRRDVT